MEEYIHTFYIHSIYIYRFNYIYIVIYITKYI